MKSKIETLKTADLTIDPEVQRALRKARVEELAREFDPEALGVLTGNRRADGTVVIVDGQHRWAAAKEVGHPSLKVQVYQGLSRSDEAALFRKRNNTKIVSIIDRFRVRLIEEEPVAVEIMKYLADNGWHIAVARKTYSGAFASVGAIEWVYYGANRSKEPTPWAARQTIEVLTAAWGTQAETMAAPLIRGMGTFLVRYSDANENGSEHQVDLTKLIHQMQKYPGGPIKMAADASFTAQTRRMPTADAVASILTNEYNWKRTVNRLPEWTKK